MGCSGPHEVALRHQVLKESLGLPSSVRSPRWFTASLRREAAAKTFSQADGRAGKGAGDGEGEASGFAKEGKNVEQFGGATSGKPKGVRPKHVNILSF